jgi:hypothetical protein
MAESSHAASAAQRRSAGCGRSKNIAGGGPERRTRADGERTRRATLETAVRLATVEGLARPGPVRERIAKHQRQSMQLLERNVAEPQATGELDDAPASQIAFECNALLGRGEHRVHPSRRSYAAGPRTMRNPRSITPTGRERRHQSVRGLHRETRCYTGDPGGYIIEVGLHCGRIGRNQQRFARQLKKYVAGRGS